MNFIDINTSETKDEIFIKVEEKIRLLGFTITEIDIHRPWGGFIRIAEEDAPQFRRQFFQGKEYAQDLIQTPKILIIAPHQRLSWQYHYRRKEIWKVLSGPIKVARGETDDQQVEFDYYKGDIIELALSERHRLIGTDVWGIVAEIWYHTDQSNPSNEDDIVRLADDYGR